mgnify:FL=1
MRVVDVFEESCGALRPGLIVSDFSGRPGRSEALPLSTESSGGGCYVHRFLKKRNGNKKGRNTENSPCPARSAGHRFPVLDFIAICCTYIL